MQCSSDSVLRCGRGTYLQSPECAAPQFSLRCGDMSPGFRAHEYQHEDEHAAGGLINVHTADKFLSAPGAIVDRELSNVGIRIGAAVLFHHAS